MKIKDDHFEDGSVVPYKRHAYGNYKFTWEQFKIEQPNWKQTILDLAQDGDGKTSWMVYLGLNWKTWKNFIVEEEFSEVVEQAELLELLYWEREARRLVSGDSTRFPGASRGNAFVFALVMHNKFGWNNRREAIDSNTPALAKPGSTDNKNEKNEYTAEELAAELISRGLPIEIFSSYEPEEVDYADEEKHKDSIDGQFVESQE